MCVYRCKCVHTDPVHPPLWPSPLWASNWWLAPGQHPNTLFSPCFLLLPLCCSAPARPESHRNSALGELGTGGHRAIFSWGHHTHTRPGEGPPFDRREPWKLAATTKPVFSVSLSPELRPESGRHQRSGEDSGVGIWWATHRCRGGPADRLAEQQSSYSRQPHSLNANEARQGCSREHSFGGEAGFSRRRKLWCARQLNKHIVGRRPRVSTRVDDWWL